MNRFASSRFFRSPVLLFPLVYAGILVGNASGQFARGRFVAHVISGQKPGGEAWFPDQVVTSPVADVDLTDTSHPFVAINFISGKVQVAVPVETPLAFVGASGISFSFLNNEVLPISANFTADFRVAYNEPPPDPPPLPGPPHPSTTLFARGSFQADEMTNGIAGGGIVRTSEMGAAPTKGLHTLSSSGEGKVEEGDANQLHPDLGFPPNTYSVVITSFRTGTLGEEAQSWQVNVFTYYTFSEPDAIISITSPTPIENTILEEGLLQGFSATVNYKLLTEPFAELTLGAYNAAGQLLAFANPRPVQKLETEQSQTMVIEPFAMNADMQQITLRAALVAGASVLATGRQNVGYPVLRNELGVNQRLPAENSLRSGTSVAFSLSFDHWLRTRPDASLILEVVRQTGEVVASSPVLAITRTQVPQRTLLTTQTIAILNEYRTLALRLRMSSGQTVLREALQSMAYLIDPEPETLRVIKVVEDAEVRCPGTDWFPPDVGTYLVAGCQISTGPDAEVHLLFSDRSVMIVKQMTEILVSTLLREGNAFKAQVLLKIGEVSAQVNPDKVVTTDFSVSTPVATASVRGTAFTLRHVTVPEAMSTLEVNEGDVEFAPKNAGLELLNLTVGQTASVTATEAKSADGPTIAQVTPASGTAGDTQVTITGTKFSPVAANNLVLFGGVAAEASSATATQLVATVPVGLATGNVPLEVSLNGLTNNAIPFGVMASQPPTSVSGDLSGTWTRSQSPYRVTGAATVPAGQMLSISPGVVVIFEGTDASLHVHGTLVAAGTAAAPIQFLSASANKAAGQWGGIKFYDSSDDAATRLSHCVIEHAGAAPFAAAVQFAGASPLLEFCTVRTNLGHGLHLAASAPKLSRGVITGNMGSALWVEGGLFPTLEQTLAIENGRDVVSVAAQTLSDNSVWPYSELPYLLHGDVEVAAARTLTIAPGCEIQALGTDTDLIVHGSLFARGTVDRFITFTSDEAPQAKARGQWGALVFDGAGIGSELTQCVVEFGGASRNGQVELLAASPVVSESLFHNSAGDGLFASNSNSQFERCRFLGNGRDGLRVAVAGTLAVHSSVLSGNTGLGINNLTTQRLDAQGNYWGHKTGPLDNSNADGAWLLNPGGLGSPVSEFVDWTNPLNADPSVTAAQVPDFDLQIARNGTGDLVISWLDGVATNIVLQESASPNALVTWQTSTAPTALVGSRRQAVVPINRSTQFFRLLFAIP